MPVLLSVRESTRTKSDVGPFQPFGFLALAALSFLSRRVCVADLVESTFLFQMRQALSPYIAIAVFQFSWSPQVCSGAEGVLLYCMHSPGLSSLSKRGSRTLIVFPILVYLRS